MGRGLIIALATSLLVERLKSNERIDHLAVELPVHLVEMPLPVPKPAHPVEPLASNITCEHGSKPVPPEPHRLVAKVDAAFEQQILDVPQAQRELHVHHHHQPDHLRR